MDKYLGFTYRGNSLSMEKDSAIEVVGTKTFFRGFIMNEGEDLHFVNSPGVDNEFVQVPFGEQTFYLGNTKGNRSFSLTIVLKEFTLKEYRRFLGWLNFDEKGTLIFDYNSNYGYNVKVEEIGEGQFDVVSCEGDDKYNITLDVSFITTERWTAKWIGTEPVWRGIDHPNNISVDNDQDEPNNTWIVEPRANEFTFYNRHNVNNAIKIEFISTIEFLGVTLHGTGNTSTYYSEYGIIIGSDGGFGHATLSGNAVEVPKLIIEPGKS